MFFCFWPTLPGPRRQHNEECFWLKVFLETRLKSAPLEHVIDLLAYLEPKLWLKTQFLTKFKNFQKRHNLPSQCKLWPAITGQQIELESCSSPLKTRDVL